MIYKQITSANSDLGSATILHEEPGASIQLSNRRVGRGSPCFIIAEAGVNHNGDLDLARGLVDAAAAAGADAVKFQTWITDNICLPGARKATYQAKGTLGDDDQYSMLKRLELPYSWHRELKDRAESLGLVFLSTPDDLQSARFLCDLGIEALKIGSAEVTNIPHLDALAALKKPLILSTGMSTLEEVASAVTAIQKRSESPLFLLHCVSAYPAPEEEMNLRAVVTLRETFKLPVGLSDHSQGFLPAQLGIALGIVILEKHLTLDPRLDGPDHAASASPATFKELVRAIRRSETILGSGVKDLAPSESNTREAVLRTLIYSKDLTRGHLLAEEDILALRSSQPGIHANALPSFLNRMLVRSVTGGTAVAYSDVA